ncbi:MAG: OmpA family protein [Alphaproteobacteria bacterium]|nr:OmpA family protein [Alphaproteobacteria bacterium]
MIPALLLSSALAQTTPTVPRLDAHTLAPALDAPALFLTDTTGFDSDQRGFARVLFGYAYAPLVADDAMTGDKVDIVRHLAHADLMGGYQAGPVRIGVRVPLVYGTGDLGEGGGLGDVLADLRVTLLRRDRKPLGLALGAGITAPTATGLGVALGRGGVGWSARAVLDGRVGPALLAGQLAVQGGPDTGVDEVAWSTLLQARFGSAITLTPVVDLTAEITAGVDVAGPVTLRDAPLELLVGTALHTQRGVRVRVGAGAGLTPGVGTPAARALLGLDWEKKPTLEVVEEVAPVPVRLVFVDATGTPLPGVLATLGDLGGVEGDDGVTWSLPPGVYALQAQAEDRARLRRDLVVPEAGLDGLEIGLGDAPPPGFGRVVLSVQGEGGEPVAARWKAGDLHGVLDAGEGRLTLPEGRHLLAVSAEGFGAARLQLDVLPGGESIVALVLQAPQVTVLEDRIALRGRVFFATDTAVLSEASHPLLRELAQTLVDHPEITRVRIEGHTDRRGSAGYNLRLSEARARAVQAFLVALGVDPLRMEAAGMGESRPLDPEDSIAAWAVNRRVEVHIVERRPAVASSASFRGASGEGVTAP